MYARWIYSTLFVQFYLQNNVRTPSNGFFRVQLKTVPYTFPALWQNMLSWHSLNGVHSISPSNHEFTGVSVQPEDTIWKENLTDTARTASISSMEPATKYSKKGIWPKYFDYITCIKCAQIFGSHSQFYVNSLHLCSGVLWEFSSHLNSYTYFSQAK